jgi:hypothetical protein
MLVRMANTDASEAARLLVRQRWGNRGVERAVAVIVSRADELTPEQRDRLAEATGQEAGDEWPGTPRRGRRPSRER